MFKRALIVVPLLLLIGCGTRFGIRAPVSNVAVPDLSGTWNTQWGSEYIAVVFMKQEGDRVTASYTTTAVTEKGEGTIEGSLEGHIVGNELKGSWEEGGKRFGRFRFVFNAEARSFEGTWGNKELDDNGGGWTGTR